MTAEPAGADRAPDSRAAIPPERWAALAARHAPPRAQHVGRESYQTLAGRLAGLRSAHTALADRHAELVAAQDQLLADLGALAEERDAWRRRAADAARRADRAEATLRDLALGHLSWFVGGGVAVALLFAALYVLGG